MADDGSGYGQQSPSASVGGFNPIAFAIEQALALVSTIKTVKVLSVDTDKKTVSVQIAVNQINGINQANPHGTINGIPYIWAMGGKNAFEIDPVVGDIGVMIVNDRDISSVKAAMDIANPGSNRKFSVSDGIYLFGVPALNSAAPEQWIKFNADGIEWHDKNNNVLSSNASGISINGVVFNRNGQVAGNLPVTGNLDLGGTIQALDGTGYTADISTSGRFHGLDFQIGATGTLISLSGHWHAALNAAPILGH